MELLLQLILEPLFFAYYDLVDYFVGDKQLKKWQEYLLKILCFVISFISCFLVLIGSFWITDTEPFNKYGLIFLIVGGTILLLHILIGLFVGVNHFVEEKRKEDFLDFERFEENEPTPQIYYIGEDNNEKEYFLDFEKFEENELTPQIYYIEEDNNEKKDL